ncbi:MAG: hypothetical protein WCC36_05555 [Gammaproteobacteria bacterium]
MFVIDGLRPGHLLVARRWGHAQLPLDTPTLYRPEPLAPRRRTATLIADGSRDP